MKRIIPRIAPLFLVLTLVWFLDHGFHGLPPIGRFFDPFNGFWANAKSDKIHLPEELLIKGLHQTAHVQYDKNLIPHLQCQTNRDLYFTQGYITAQHRLWQMDYCARAAAGELSEVLGKKALRFDRLQRRKGITSTARKIVRKIKSNDTLWEILTAYSEGVNAYIDTLGRQSLPLEYKLLDYQPRSWSPYQSVLLAVHLYDQWSGSGVAIPNSNAFQLLGKNRFNLLFPEHTSQCPPTFPSEKGWSFKPIEPPTPPSNNLKVSTPLKVTMNNRHFGGNAWVVRGKKTVTGKPFFANDIHMPLELPSMWYLLHLKSPEVNAVGASIIGLPNIVLGFNEHIAWGMKNNAMNVRDWFKIDFVDPERTEYRYDQRTFKTHHVKEEIKIKGEESFIDTIVYTHHGPIVFDKSFSDSPSSLPLASQWTGEHAALELLCFYHINRAQKCSDVEKAIHQFYDGPPQYFTVADLNNDIGIYLSGSCPLRAEEQGKFVMPGNQSIFESNHMVPKEHLPRLQNPEKQYLCTANERSTDRSYPYYYTYSERHFAGRKVRILGELDKSLSVNASFMMKLQNDTYSLEAQQYLPVLLKYINPIVEQLTPEQKKAFQVLSNWNFKFDITELGASLFAQWKEQITKKLWERLAKKEEATIWNPNFSAIFQLLTRRAKFLPSATSNPGNVDQGDNNNSDVVHQIISEAFIDAVKVLSQWEKQNQQPYQWGAVRKMPIHHIAQLPSLGIDHVAVAGEGSTVNNNDRNAGVGFRLLVSLKSRQQSQGWVIYPGGQEGNPGSPFYANLISLWKKGKYLSVNLQELPKSELLGSVKLMAHR